MSKKARNNSENGFRAEYILQEGMPFSIQEAYKSLRTNLTYSLPGGRKCLAIGITSANRAEGKSTSSLNLALSYASIGKRVLLIDCDLRCPSIANKLHSSHIKGQPGMSEFLIGKTDLKPCIQRLPGTTLEILPSGTIPPDATSLLEAEGMGEFFKRLREFYEVIIVDLPPILSVTDAAIMSRHVDGMLLTVRHNSTCFAAAEEALRQLRMVDAKVLGFLYNDAPLESKKYGKKYGSKYGSRYYAYTTKR